MAKSEVTSNVKTLIVGVGGLGSYMVSKVKTLLGDADVPWVNFMALDTDVNAIAELKNLDKSSEIIQTSFEGTVNQYIENRKRQGDHKIEEWFQTEIPHLKYRELVNGSGQVRAISRLGYQKALEKGEINKYVKALNEVFLPRDETQGTGLRICIMGSIVGGTGSGIFLQISGLLHALASKKFSQEQIQVHGYFMLPDILTSTGKITDWSQTSNIYANAYASVKELMAFTRMFNNQKVIDQVELDFMPPGFQPMDRKKWLPFSSIFLIDSHNVEGNPLETLEDYASMMSEYVYQIMFSDVGRKAFSATDNNIGALVESEGENRFGGIGVGKIEYPKDDIIRYFSLSKSIESLSEKWQKFDLAYREDLKEYQRRLIAGERNLREPKLRDKYLFYLENEASSDDTFYRIIHDQLFVFDENGNKTAPKATVLGRGVDMTFKKTVEEDQVFQSLFESILSFEMEDLTDEENMVNTVSETEERLKRLKREANRICDDNKILASNMLYRDFDVKDYRSGDPAYFNTYVLNPEQPMHPLSNRAFLYQFQQQNERDINRLESELSSIEETLAFFDERFDDKSTRDVKETALDIAQEIVNKNSSFFGKVKSAVGRGKEAKNFAMGYRNYASKYRQKISEYATIKLALTVKRKIYDDLSDMEALWANFFNSINNLIASLSEERDSISNKFRNESGYNYWVLGDSEVLKKLWQNKSLELFSSPTSSPETSKFIYHTLYQQLYKMNNKTSTHLNLEEAFYNKIARNIVSAQTKQIEDSELLNFDLLDAIRTEAMLTGQDPKMLLEDLMKRLNNVVVPFGPDADRIIPGTNQLYIWSFHETIKERMPHEIRMGIENPANGVASHIISNEFFSTTKISKAVVLSNQNIECYQKFDYSVGGKYFEAYRSRVDGLFDPKKSTYSPHLDKRWHLPAFLPALDKDLNLIRKQQLAMAMFKGFMIGKLRILKHDGQETLVYGSNPVALDGAPPSLEVPSLLDLLAERLDIQKQIESDFVAQMLEEKKKHQNEVSKYKLIDNAKKARYPVGIADGDSCTLLDMATHFFYSSYFDEETHKELGEVVVKSLVESLLEVVKYADGTLNEREAGEELEKLLKNHFVRQSTYYKSKSEESSLYIANIQDDLGL